MTVVCCWLERSFSRERITVLADSRVTTRTGCNYKTLDETQLKLFRIRMRCNDLTALDPQTGAFTMPYYTTDIGIGYSGFCFESLTIIAQATRLLEELLAVDGGQPKPQQELVVEFLRTLVAKYFAQHKNPKEQAVDFYVCGYSQDQRPWLAHVSHRTTTGAKAVFLPLGPFDFHVIGTVTQETNYKAKVAPILKTIRRKQRAIRAYDGDHFDKALQDARTKAGQKQAIEQETLNMMRSEYVHSVGGVLQKMEISWNGVGALVAFTEDHGKHLVDEMPVVGNPRLQSVPFTEKMGDHINRVESTRRLPG